MDLFIRKRRCELIAIDQLLKTDRAWYCAIHFYGLEPQFLEDIIGSRIFGVWLANDFLELKVLKKIIH